MSPILRPLSHRLISLSALFPPSSLTCRFHKYKTTILQRQGFCAASISSSAAAAGSSSSLTTKNLVSDSKNPISDESSLEWVSRTAYCGNLTAEDVGRRVRLCGWVALHRIHGGLTFLNLRDHTGIVQITTLPDQFPDAHFVVNKLRLEYVIAVEGFVRSRPSESINKKMNTGMVEVAAEYVLLLNSVKSALPFLVTTADGVKETLNEEIRLRYRCLDLRRKQMSSNLMLRHRVVKLIRRYLEDVHGFVEVD